MPAACEPASGAGERALKGTAFPDDDGQPDPQVRARLANPRIPVPEALGSTRLLVAVAPVPDEIDADGSVHRHMGLVSMINAQGERGLLAFTGLDAMAAWDPSARPMPVSVADAAHAALDHGAVALVIDVMGPVRAAVTGEVLHELAHGAEGHGHAHDQARDAARDTARDQAH